MVVLNIGDTDNKENHV